MNKVLLNILFNKEQKMRKSVSKELLRTSQMKGKKRRCEYFKEIFSVRILEPFINIYTVKQINS